MEGEPARVHSWKLHTARPLTAQVQGVDYLLMQDVVSTVVCEWGQRNWLHGVTMREQLVSGLTVCL